MPSLSEDQKRVLPWPPMLTVPCRTVSMRCPRDVRRRKRRVVEFSMNKDEQTHVRQLCPAPLKGLSMRLQKHPIIAEISDGAGGWVVISASTTPAPVFRDRSRRTTSRICSAHAAKITCDPNRISQFPIISGIQPSYITVFRKLCHTSKL